jgi:hypothetical protein
VKLIWERIAGDFTPHFIAARRGTLTERLGFECRDGLARGNRFLQGFSPYDVGLNVSPPTVDLKYFHSSSTGDVHSRLQQMKRPCAASRTNILFSYQPVAGQEKRLNLG